MALQSLLTNLSMRRLSVSHSHTQPFTAMDHVAVSDAEEAAQRAHTGSLGSVMMVMTFDLQKVKVTGHLKSRNPRQAHIQGLKLLPFKNERNPMKINIFSTPDKNLGQTDRQTDRQTDGRTDGQTDRQTALMITIPLGPILAEG